MRIQADSAAVVINRCMTDSNLGHDGVGILKDIQINTLCVRKRDDAVAVSGVVQKIVTGFPSFNLHFQ